MPSISPSFLNQLQITTRDDYPVFIETGTHLGETIFAMQHVFAKLYTIDIQESFYRNAQQKAKDAAITNIEFLYGDSAVLFPELLARIVQPAIFFLDGHWSGGNTGRGDKDCPLVEECQSIMAFYKPRAVIIIDDYRLFGTKTATDDWSDISKQSILQIFGDRIQNVYLLESEQCAEDRLVLHIDEVKM
jgi:SAM-dependent methyltransferase